MTEENTALYDNFAHYLGKLWMYLISSRAQPTRRGPTAWRLGDLLTTPHCKNEFVTKCSHKKLQLWIGILFRIETGVLFFFLGRRRKGTTSKCSKKKRTEIFYVESLLQILRQKEMDDADVDVYKCFLLSVLPSFRQFNDEQKFRVRQGCRLSPTLFNNYLNEVTVQLQKSIILDTTTKTVLLFGYAI